MEVKSFKTITLDLTEHESWLLQEILTQSKCVKTITGGFSEFRDNLLTDLSKEIARKI